MHKVTPRIYVDQLLSQCCQPIKTQKMGGNLGKNTYIAYLLIEKAMDQIICQNEQ